MRMNVSTYFVTEVVSRLNIAPDTKIERAYTFSSPDILGDKNENLDDDPPIEAQAASSDSSLHVAVVEGEGLYGQTKAELADVGVHGQGRGHVDDILITEDAKRSEVNKTGSIGAEGLRCWVYNATGLSLQYAVSSRSSLSGKRTPCSMFSQLSGYVSPADSDCDCVTSAGFAPLKGERVCSVPHGRYDGVIVKEVAVAPDEEELAFCDNLNVRELRDVFMAADEDGSGMLSTDEISDLLCTSTGKTLDDPAFSRFVADFIERADSDHSNEISWSEFRIAVTDSMLTASYDLAIHIQGFEPVEGVCIGTLGTQLFVLQPDLSEAFHANVAIERVAMGGKLATTLAVELIADDHFGLTVTIRSALRVRNGTVNDAELLLSSMVPRETPAQNALIGVVMEEENVHRGDERQRSASSEMPDDMCDDDGTEGFGVVCALPRGCAVAVPLQLVGTGYFASRQKGESEWSNFMPLNDRAPSDGTGDNKYARAFLESCGNAIDEVDNVDISDDGRKPRYDLFTLEQTLLERVDGQPVMRRLRKSVQPTLPPGEAGRTVMQGAKDRIDCELVMNAQFRLHNLLPCAMEYMVMQLGDDEETLLGDAEGLIKLMDSDNLASAVAEMDENDGDHAAPRSSRAAPQDTKRTGSVTGLHLRDRMRNLSTRDDKRKVTVAKTISELRWDLLGSVNARRGVIHTTGGFAEVAGLDMST